MTVLRSYLLAALAAAAIFTAPVAEAQSAAHKFGRGLAGMTLGFLEIPGNIVQQSKAQGAIGIPIGLAYGLGMTVTRELTGVYEFLSAPFPVPSGFRPILRPEYPWGYFQ